MANGVMTGVDYVRGLSNPAKTHLWYLYFNAIPGYKADGEDIKFNIHTTAIPSVQTSVITVPWQGQLAGYPGNRTFSHTLPCSIMETEDGLIGKILYSWAQVCGRNVDGTMLAHGDNAGSSSDSQYKTDATLVHLNEGRSVINAYSLKNVWLQTVGDVALNQNTAGLVMYTATFYYDWWEMADLDGNELFGGSSFDNFGGIAAPRYPFVNVKA
jgi:hypothetical protein